MTVELTKRATRELDALRRARPNGLAGRAQPVIFEKLVAKIRTLSEDSKAGKALVGPLKGIWSLRVGDYRILYEVGKARVIVLTVNHRREAYK